MRILSTAAAGTARSRPKNPTSVPPGEEGEHHDRRVELHGALHHDRADEVVVDLLDDGHHHGHRDRPCESPPPVVRAMTMPGTAPTQGPISGIMLNRPAIMPTISQKGRSMMSHADRGHRPRPRGRRPADPGSSRRWRWLRRREHHHHVAAGPLGHERPGRLPQMGQVDEQVERDDRRQHEDDADVEDLEQQLTGGVELRREAVLLLLRRDRAVPVRVDRLVARELLLQLVVGGDLDRPVVRPPTVRTGRRSSSSRSWRSSGHSVGQVVVLPCRERRHEQDHEGDDGGDTRGRRDAVPSTRGM